MFLIFRCNQVLLVNLLLPLLCHFLHFLRGNAAGEEQGHLGADRPYHLVEDGRRENNGQKQFPHLLGKQPLSQKRQTDGNTGLRDQSQAHIISNFPAGSRNQAADIRSQILPDNSHDKVCQTHRTHSGQRRQIQIHARHDKEYGHDRRRKVINLPVQLLIAGKIDIRRAEDHAGQQRRNIERRADTRDPQKHGNSQNQPVVLASGRYQKPAQEVTAEKSQTQSQDIIDHRHQDRGHGQLFISRSSGDACHNTERQKADHIIQRHDLQQRIDKFSLCLILVDRHHRAGRCCRRRDCAQNQRKIPLHLEDAHTEQRYQHAGQQGLEERDDNDPASRL